MWYHYYHVRVWSDPTPHVPLLRCDISLGVNLTISTLIFAVVGLACAKAIRCKTHCPLLDCAFQPILGVPTSWLFFLFIKERGCPTKTYTLKPWIAPFWGMLYFWISGQTQILENTSCCRSQTTQVVGVMVMGGTEKKVQRHAGRKSASWLMWWLNQQKWWLNEIWLDLYNGIFLTYVYNRIIPSP